MARSYWTKTVRADRGREPSDLNEIGRTGSFESRSNGVGRPAGPSGARVAGNARRRWRPRRRRVGLDVSVVKTNPQDERVLPK